MAAIRLVQRLVIRTVIGRPMEFSTVWTAVRAFDPPAIRRAMAVAPGLGFRI